jgi:hypothetical protein
MKRKRSLSCIFEKLDESALRSKVLVADEELDPPEELLEDAEIA